MKRKLLLAVDDSRHSVNAVHYATGYYHLVKEVELDLLHVQPALSGYLLEEAKRSPKAYAELNRLMKRHDRIAGMICEDQKARTVSMGVPEEAIGIKTIPRKLGVSKDILEYSQAGQVDAVVMGRRGISGVAEMFAGSVSSNVVENARVVPVWLVDGIGSLNNIMLAVDGSESALRAVDHLAFVLGPAPATRITFFHVTPRLQDVCPIDFDEDEVEEIENIIRKSDTECLDRFFTHATKRLQEAGIGKDQIDVKVKRGVLRVGKAILEAFGEGEFGTLVVGRRGMGKTFFTGSVSRYLINHFSNGALWVVP